MAYLLLISQITVNTIDCCHWMIDAETEIVELTNNVEDSEQDKEEHKKNLSNKYRIQSQMADAQDAFLKCLHAQDVAALHIPEIHTPPPECNLS